MGYTQEVYPCQIERCAILLFRLAPYNCRTALLGYSQEVYLQSATMNYTQVRELLQHIIPRLAGESEGFE